jgi:heme/copper-type cytochrome/quinol oxidase subunit 2
MATPEPTSQHRPVIVWDLILTIVFLVISVVLAVAMMGFGFLSNFTADSCETPSCFSTVATGSTIAIVTPLLIVLIALVVAIVRRAKRRIAFWVPLVGIALSFAGCAAGVALVRSTIQIF